jgi:ADP-ribose pyrophosphatase YjhB (NUDIX family)
MEATCLPNTRDVYNTRYISHQDLPKDPQLFEQLLAATIEAFRQEKVKGVCLEVSLDDYLLLGVTKKFGFSLHHTDKDVITLQKWLPETKNRLPAYSTHYIGVGGLVIDFEAKKVLVIKEKQGNNTLSWKIPGGLVDSGEYLSEAVEREVREETGIEAQFKGILTLREKRVYNFGRNDIYFVCLLEPVSRDIKMCEVEVAHCKWIDINEWSAQKFEVQIQQIVCEMARELLETYEKSRASYLENALVSKEVRVNLPNVKTVHTMYVRPKYSQHEAEQ